MEETEETKKVHTYFPIESGSLKFSREAGQKDEFFLIVLHPTSHTYRYFHTGEKDERESVCVEESSLKKKVKESCP